MTSDRARNLSTFRVAPQLNQGDAPQIPGLGMSGLEDEKSLVGQRRVGIAFQPKLKIGAPEQRLRVLRVQLHGPVQGCKGVRVTLERKQTGGAILPDLGIIGLERNGAVIARKGLRRAIQGEQRAGFVGPGLGQTRPHGGDFLRVCQCLGGAAQPQKSAAAIAKRFDIVRLERDGAVETLHRLIQAIQLQ